MAERKAGEAPRRALEQREEAYRRHLSEGWSEAADDAGDALRCRKGCDACCREPFPISRLDARWLRQGMAQLSAWRPEVVEEIRRRGRRLLQRWEGRFPGEFAQGRLSQDLDALDTFFAAERGQTCPVLEPGTGACLLYAHRPVPCRTFGPPLKFGTEPSNPCRLCFRRSTGEEVESCRWEPDPNGLEEALLLELGARPGQDWETMIACVVAEEKVDEDR